MKKNESTNGGCLQQPCSTAPSWPDFVARITKAAPLLKPDRNDEQWTNLYGVYEIGYEACLDRVKMELEQVK